MGMWAPYLCDHIGRRRVERLCLFFYVYTWVILAIPGLIAGTDRWIAWTAILVGIITLLTLRRYDRRYAAMLMYLMSVELPAQYYFSCKCPSHQKLREIRNSRDVLLADTGFSAWV